MRSTRPEPTDLADVGGLRRAGAWFLAASVLWWIAAAALIPPDDYFFNGSARDEALAIAAHAGMFRAFHVVATAGIAAGVVGMVVLARSLRSREPSRVVDTAAAVATAAWVVWVVEAVIRATARVANAREVAAGTSTPASEPAVGSWPVFALAAVGFAMPMLCAWVLARRRLPGRRSSLATAVVLTLFTFVAAGTLAPSMVYQFGLLPLSLCLVLAYRRHTPATAPEAAGSWAA